MNSVTTTSIADAVRNLIVCDTQFSEHGSTTLNHSQLLDLQSRGWLIEGDENNEFDLTEAGNAVVARALGSADPGAAGELPPLPRPRDMGFLHDRDRSLRVTGFTAQQMADYARATLAAHQPVGQEPLGWLFHWNNGVTEFTEDLVEADAHRDLKNCTVTAIYAAPPTQPDEPNTADIRLTPAVDLKQFLPALEAYAELAQADATPDRFMEAGRLLNLIHGQEASHD